jgi:hypothetical protein
MANTYTLIASSTVGAGGASSIDFTSIPATFTDLVIKLSARSNNGAVTGNLAIQFNGSATSFSRKVVRGNGSSASSTGNADNYVADIVGNTATASTFGNWEIYIPNYAGNTNKSYSVDTVTENNATEAWQYLLAGLWSNTAAITSIKLLDLSASFNFVQYSTAYLYGVKNA